MKKSIYFILALSFVITTSNAQQKRTVASDFTMNDCNGQMHNLFTELNGGNVIIMEFFHTCSSCISAANDIKPMYQNLVAQYGNKVRFFVLPSDDDYSCTQVMNWVSTNNFSSIVVPFDSGATQMAYYGGSGMPTIAVVAGSSHKVLFTQLGLAPSDTTIIGDSIRHFFNPTGLGIQNKNSNTNYIQVYPNPASNNFNLSFDTKEAGTFKVQLTNIVGQTVVELAEEKLQVGNWNQTIPINSLPDGIYFIKGQFNEKIFYEKITVQQ